MDCGAEIENTVLLMSAANAYRSNMNTHVNSYYTTSVEVFNALSLITFTSIYLFPTLLDVHQLRNKC